MTTATRIQSPVPRHEAQRKRVQAIRDGARVRKALGQAALYRARPGGAHEVTWRGQVFTADTVDEAIDEALRRNR